MPSPFSVTTVKLESREQLLSEYQLVIPVILESFRRAQLILEFCLLLTLLIE